MATRRLPSIFYNWTTAVGALIAAVTFSIIFLLYLIDLVVKKTTIYLGLVTFVILPILLIFGLALIGVGAFLERRRLARGTPSAFSGLIRIDLQNMTHRNALVLGLTGAGVFLLASAVGTYKAYQKTESVAFCGQLCHSVMHPEFTAYQTSPHARVACVQCHIGPGADWFVKAKLSGAYQVYAVAANVYPRPIPTPVRNLRPARETCEQCHWPEQFFGARKDVNHHFLADEANTPWPITVLINVGGGSEATGKVEGIHWHMAIANKVQYIARDGSRQEIAWVRVEDRTGKVAEYSDAERPLTPEERARAEVRTLDCIDCHNRPSHVYRSPVQAVNEAMAIGRIDRTLPYIKREAVKALDAEYPDTPSALRAIEERLTKFYQESYPEVFASRRAAVDGAVAGVQRVYQQNFFPEMKVSWNRYPDNIGHSQFVGCFRCHGERLRTAEGQTITKDCAACHSILAQGTDPATGTYSPKGLAFQHPVDVEGAEKEGNCTECHAGGAELY